MAVTCDLVGKGRGRQVIAVARTADVVIMMLDATKGDVQRCVIPSLRVCWEYIYIDNQLNHPFFVENF